MDLRSSEGTGVSSCCAEGNTDNFRVRILSCNDLEAPGSFAGGAGARGGYSHRRLASREVAVQLLPRYKGCLTWTNRML